jgi:hypothetical protein
MSIVNVAVCFAGIIVLLILYKFVFNPQVVVTASRENMSQCPDRWTFSNGLCKPNYQTQCAPFDPTKITSSAQACNIARTCGTNWSGMC